MKLAFKVLNHCLWDLLDNLGVLTACNILFLLLCIPVVTMPLGLAGLMFVSWQVAMENSVSIGDFFRGIAKYWRRIYLSVLLDLLVILVLVSNLWFYGGLAARWRLLSLVAIFVALWACAIYFLVRMFAAPLLVMNGFSLVRGFRCGLVLLVRNPLLAVAVAMETALLVIVSLLLVLPFLLWGICLPCLACCNLVRSADGAGELGITRRSDETRTLRHIFQPWS